MSSSASPVQREKKEVNVDDRHWDDSVPRRTRNPPKTVQKCYTHSQYETHYVTMRDGVRIAADVLRPPAGKFDESRGLPCVLLQTRYQRSVVPRWPIRKLLNGRPLDLLSQEPRSWFLAAGYAVVAVDVRGTGASFGAWKAPWTREERADSRQLLDWIVGQPWSNQQVVLWGVSYDGTAAIFTAAEQHPAVKAAAPQYAFWDIYSDIGLPGGIPLHSFASTWTQHCVSFDKNDHSRLPKPNGLLLPLIVSGCQPVIEGLKMGGSSSMGMTGSSSSGSVANGTGSSSGSKSATSSDRKQRPTAAARREGLRNLHEAVRGHDTWEAAVDLGTVRCTDDMAAHAGKRVTDISACSVADRIAGSGVPLQIAAGWLDSTAGPAIIMFCNAAKAPGSRLLIGPWGHGGNMYCQLAERAATRSAFSQPLEVIGFFDKACGYRPAGRSAKAFPPQLTYGKGRDQLDSSIATAALPQRSAREKDSHRSAAGSNGASAMANGYANSYAPPVHASNGVETAAAGKQEAEEPAVRYFVMGCRPHWKSSASWPPEDLADQPRVLYLGKGRDSSGSSNGSSSEGGTRAAQNGAKAACPQVSATAAEQGSNGAAANVGDSASGSRNDDGTPGTSGGVPEVPPCTYGGLDAAAPDAALRWRQEVDTSRYLKGKSRFDVITQPKGVIQYHRLRSAGHTLFTGKPLAAELQIVGWVEVELWVASSDADADVFVYLEDFDPAADRARYVTEGHFRASHRREHEQPPAGDPRAGAHLPGMPFHSFSRADLQPLQPQVPVRVRFLLLPTAYGFSAGHCVRLAVAGADAKHFTVDHEGDRTMWIHTGASTPSRVKLPEIDLRKA